MGQLEVYTEPKGSGLGPTHIDNYRSYGKLFSKISSALDHLETNIGCFENEPSLPDPGTKPGQRDIRAIDPPDADGKHHAFEVNGHKLALRILRNGELFSSSIYRSIPGASVGESLLMMDGAAHTALRSSLKEIFKFSSVEAYKTDIFRPLAHRLIDAFPRAGSFDLIQAFTFEFPARCLTQIIGFPEEDEAWVHSRTIELLCVAFDRTRALNARQALSDYFTPMLRQGAHKKRGALGVIAGLCQGGKMTEEEGISFLRLLLLAGTETSFRSLSNLIATLFTHPGLMHRLVANPSDIKAAVAESLRWEPASFDIHREATQDTTLHGLEIPKGSRVSINRRNVNRDERLFADPENFDLDRPPTFNFAFSAGAHHCIGLGIAMAEMQVALEVLLSRCPHIQVDPTQPPPRIQGHQFRRPKHIPVILPPNEGSRHAL